MKKIIVDFDNTFTLHGKDVDDLLALLYLLSRDDVEVPFVCTTFGNGTLEQVNRCTRDVFSLLKLPIPIYSGAEKAGAANEAARKTAAYLRAHPGEVHLLALGSLRNMADLLELDPAAPKKVASFVAMGGITAPLHFLGRVIPELNFSVDPRSSARVLRAFSPATVLTGNHCLEHIHTKADLPKEADSRILRHILASHLEWMDYSETIQEEPGVVLWDVIAALYMTEPERFTDQIGQYGLNETELRTGSLVPAAAGFAVNTPTLTPDNHLYSHIFQQIASMDQKEKA